MSSATSAALIERLRQVHSENGETISYEELAARLPITLSTLNRWKNETPKKDAELFQMLEDAGWLNQVAVQAALQALNQRQAEEAAARAVRLDENAKKTPRGKQHETGA